MFSRFRNLFRKSKHENDKENDSDEEHQTGSDKLETQNNEQHIDIVKNGKQNVERIQNAIPNGVQSHENTNGVHAVSACSSSSISPKTDNQLTTTISESANDKVELVTPNLTSVSSVAAEDLTLEVLTPSVVAPTSLGERIANDANNNSEESSASSDPQPASHAPAAARKATIVINPTGNNNIACEAISQKLNEIAAVAGSLDAAIRDVQNGADTMETNSSTSSSEKKPNASGSSSGEDWHSRSTEDDSFATASEGNFTPHSHSSSFQTASGHTSLLLSSSGKNSFDTSEADDSTLSAFEIPELMTSPHNASFDSSDHSFLSAKQDTLSSSPATETRTPTFNAEVNDDENSVADVEELHSQSVTPTPDDTNFQSIPVESETELESYIADAPSLEILTEETPAPLTSVTPEVSTCSSNLSYKQQQQQLQLQQRDTNNVNKTNAAWRRSKYYENITKQTIRGFL